MNYHHKGAISSSAFTVKNERTPFKLPVTDQGGVQAKSIIREVVKDLPPGISQKLGGLLTAHRTVFCWDGTSLGRTNLVQHRIPTGDAPQSVPRPEEYLSTYKTN
jgi:hypothetical protein